MDKHKVEAVLFALGKEASIERLASLCSLSEKQVEKSLNEIQKDYTVKEGSLQLIKKDLGWKLTVKDKFIPLVSNIVTSTEMDRPLMDTLAVIAWKYPIVQSEIVKLRNQSAYDHMRQLQEMGFITKERFGRTYKVKLTSKFFEYFDLPSEEAKSAFLKNVPSNVLEDAEDVDKEADEVERLIELESSKEATNEELKKAMAEVTEN